jgi:hypothetical protein
MAQRPEYRPGEAAPTEGTYEQINILGQPTGIRVDVPSGHPLPRAPIGHVWRLIGKDGGDDPV